MFPVDPSRVQAFNSPLLACAHYQVVNLISNDAQKFEEGSVFLHYIWASVVQSIVCLGLLWREVCDGVLRNVICLVCRLLSSTVCLVRLCSSSTTSAL